jgi:ABC-type nitrate/sulfonate/bicarbonate transport system substrate-binding protein
VSLERALQDDIRCNMTTKIVVALDWTPNTNHAGFFIAHEHGLYADAGLDVEFMSPLDSNYEKTPRMLVEAATAHFGIAPSETVISCHTADNARPEGQRLVAVAALLQKQVQEPQRRFTSPPHWKQHRRNA